MLVDSSAWPAGKSEAGPFFYVKKLLNPGGLDNENLTHTNIPQLAKCDVLYIQFVVHIN